jgi:hypothetical protein
MFWPFCSRSLLPDSKRMRTCVRESFVTSAEQSGSGFFGPLFTGSKFVYGSFAEWWFRTKTLEARLRLRSATCQVNLVA